MTMDKSQSLFKLTRLRPDFHRIESVDSTNNMVKTLLKQEPPQNPIVLASKQTGGKGRHGRKWLSPEGGLYLSVGIDLRIPVEQSPILVMLVGCACVASIRELTGTKVGLKWPNDLLIDDRKVGGILCELVTGLKDFYYVIAGIGINVNTNLENMHPTVQRTSTSLASIIGHPLSIERLAADIINNIDTRLDQIESKQGIDPILREWLEYSVTLGKEVSVDLGEQIITGKAIGITRDGSLIVEQGNGSPTHVTVGDVVHLRSDDTK
ncbi:MAG: hypothetical protein BAJATHORv1_30449 [Candidatus Thorarchaeota archaeon]|nr:MAG: hypothetical protein BAJATHORv1_30449 [Candidatus Thorarchaeota archaeon]